MGMSLKEGVLLQDGKFRIVGVVEQTCSDIIYKAVRTENEDEVFITEFLICDFCERDEGTFQVSINEGCDEIMDVKKSDFLVDAISIARCSPSLGVSVFEENGTIYYVMNKRMPKKRNVWFVLYVVGLLFFFVAFNFNDVYARYLFVRAIECYWAEDYENAVEWLRRGVDVEDAPSQCLLADCYIKGQGVPPDATEAVNLYRKSAEQGFAHAQNDLGVMYYKGKWVAENHEEAARWYRKAAEQGNHTAQNNLGCCYKNGKGVAQDYEEAAKWFRRAARKGNIYGLYNLGCLYRDGNGVSQSYARAAKWFRDAAIHEHKEAQYNLGCFYRDGKGVPQDDGEARKWFRKSAEQGHMMSQYNLGNYIISTSYKGAVEWYRKSAEQGCLEAQRKLDELGESY